MAEQINVASLIISIIILIVVVILIFMVCYYYNTNNNSTQSVQNPQALAAAALYKNANKNNFGDGGQCGFGKTNCCCNVQVEDGAYNAGKCADAFLSYICSTRGGNNGCHDC
jgi:hypothetical protein